MRQSRPSNLKIAVLTVAVIVAATIGAVIAMPHTETKTAQPATPPAIEVDSTVYFPSQYVNKATGPSDQNPTF